MKIILNILTHGNELIGLKVALELKKLKIDNILKVNIANKKAYKRKVRFIDQDLNRSFPGNENGNYEEKLAAKMLPKIKEADIVFDIHSTTSNLKDAVIITKLDKETQELLDVISPKYVLYMAGNKDNALISNAKIGIAFEYGNDNNSKVLIKIVNDIKKVLAHFKLIEEVSVIKRKTRYFKIDKEVKKPEGYTLLASIKNYQLVKKGDKFAQLNKEYLVADEDFYPILFGDNNYHDIFGFKGIKINK